jgi:hypothetical protein
MFDPLYKETRMHSYLPAAATAAHYDDMRAQAERRRSVPRARRARFSRLVRRPASPHMRARAA